MDNVKSAVLAAGAAFVILASLFYIGSLRADLKEAQRDSSAAKQKVQTLTESLGQTRASLASASDVQERLKTQLEESNAKLEIAVPDLGKEVEALKQKVSQLEANIAFRNKVSAWWRDLFDYTKSFKGSELRETAG